MKTFNIATKIQKNITEGEKELFKVVEKAIFTTRIDARRGHQRGDAFYITGGWVRDKILEVDSSDIDIVIKPWAYILFVDSLFNGLRNSKKFEILNSRNFIINTPTKKNFEITKLEIKYQRSLVIEIDIVNMVNSRIYDDAKTRDFTLNAIYYDLEEKRVFDPVKGLASLECRKIFSTGSSKSIFKDVNRIIRLLRISAKSGFRIAQNIDDYINNEFDRFNLLKLKSSRLEFGRICKSVKTDQIIQSLIDYKILNFFPFDVFNWKFGIKEELYERRLLALSSFLESNYGTLKEMKLKKLDKPTLLMLYWCFIFFSSSKSSQIHLESIMGRTGTLISQINKLIDSKLQGFFKMVLANMMEFHKSVATVSSHPLNMEKLKLIPQRVRMVMLEDPIFEDVQRNIISTLDFCNIGDFADILSTAVSEKKRRPVDQREKDDVKKNLALDFDDLEQSGILSNISSIKEENNHLDSDPESDPEFDIQSKESHKSSPTKILSSQKPGIEGKSGGLDLFNMSEKQAKMELKSPIPILEFQEVDLLAEDFGEVNIDLGVSDCSRILLNDLQEINLDVSVSNLVSITPNKSVNVKAGQKSKKGRKVNFNLKLREKISEQKLIINQLKGRIKKIEKKNTKKVQERRLCKQERKERVAVKKGWTLNRRYFESFVVMLLLLAVAFKMFI